MDTYLPPKYSLNSFFVRHVAHPKRMKYIKGINNSTICAVNDVGYLPHLSPVKAEIQVENSLASDSFVRSPSAFKRKEKAIPPNGMWQTFVDNTDKWRSELNALASSVGLLTQIDIDEYKKKKDENLQRLPNNSKSIQKPTTAQSVKTSANPATSYGRLNEPLLTGRRTGRQSRGSRGFGLTGKKHYIVEQADREAWMLQVLCQILQTDNLQDVQAWLVSTSDQDKERVKQLIDQAMRGLEESGRIESSSRVGTTATGTNEPPKSVTQQQDTNNKNALIDIENALQKMSLTSKISRSEQLLQEKAKYQNILKLDEESGESRGVSGSSNRRLLEPIPEALKSNDFNNLNEENGTISTTTVFNLRPQTQMRRILDPLSENLTIKLETPRANKEYKIEKVKVTMLVKNEQLNSLEEISSDWKLNDETN